jgi:protein N-terminal methyltransferase
MKIKLKAKSLLILIGVLIVILLFFKNRNNKKQQVVDENITKRVKNFQYYNETKKYWIRRLPTLRNMMNGYDRIAEADIQQSQLVLNHLLERNLTGDRKLALDCGCGIGRITKDLLLKNFDYVEMLDFNNAFIDDAKKNYLSSQEVSRVSRFHAANLEDFIPEENKYDCIWIQWVLEYMTDADVIEFFKRIKKSLKPKGICFIKESVLLEDGNFYSINTGGHLRTRQMFINLVRKSKMDFIIDAPADNMPADLNQLRIMVIR